MTTSAYEAATRHTGQSEPKRTRDGPNVSSAISTYGARSATRHVSNHAASVSTEASATRKAHATVDELMADIVEIRRRGYAIDDEQTMEGVVCYGVMVPSRQPGGEGPCAASITLLKVRATAERVPALIADLQRLAADLSDPIRRD